MKWTVYANLRNTNKASLSTKHNKDASRPPKQKSFKPLIPNDLQVFAANAWVSLTVHPSKSSTTSAPTVLCWTKLTSKNSSASWTMLGIQLRTRPPSLIVTTRSNNSSRRSALPLITPTPCTLQGRCQTHWHLRPRHPRMGSQTQERPNFHQVLPIHHKRVLQEQHSQTHHPGRRLWHRKSCGHCHTFHRRHRQSRPCNHCRTCQCHQRPEQQKTGQPYQTPDGDLGRIPKTPPQEHYAMHHYCRQHMPTPQKPVPSLQASPS
ncbi:hypothetical protein ACHAW6_000835 [Cyclotella cf. meneghiniana]